MLSNKIISVLTSQNQSAFTWRHTATNMPPAIASQRTSSCRGPKRSRRFPCRFLPCDSHTLQPCSVHIVNQDQLDFDVVMTSLNDTPLTEGQFFVMVVGLHERHDGIGNRLRTLRHGNSRDWRRFRDELSKHTAKLSRKRSRLVDSQIIRKQVAEFLGCESAATIF